MGAARRAIISINWNRLFGKANNGGPKRSRSLCRGGARRRISRGGAGKRRQRLRLQRSREPARSQTRCAIAQPHHAQQRRDRGGGGRRPARRARRLWECERDGEVVRIDPPGPLVVRLGAAVDLAVSAAVAGLGIIHLFEDWLHPALDEGSLEPMLEPWWQRFSGPFLYYPSRRLLPPPLRAFVDYIIPRVIAADRREPSRAFRWR